MTQNWCKMWIINMLRNRFKLRLGMRKIRIIISHKSSPSTKKISKNKVSASTQNYAQVDISESIWLENPTSNRWTTNTTLPSATSASKVQPLINFVFLITQTKKNKKKMKKLNMIRFSRINSKLYFWNLIWIKLMKNRKYKSVILNNWSNCNWIIKMKTL